MELKKEYSCFEKNENVFSKTLEIEQDFSETCPAYCDDIFRVVKCVSNSFINSVSVSQNDITVFGKTQIMLTYYNENSVLCYADFEEEFSRSVTAENLSDFAFARAQINDKYTDFRIINQRRIDVHFASVIKLFVYDKQKYPCLENCENAKFFKNSVKSADIIASNISRIEFDEEFSLPSDLPSINRIISANCYAHLDETKIIKDKVLVKASVDSNVLYTSGENEESVNSVSFSFNVSKIIDVSSVDENDIIICDVSAGNIFNKAKSLSGDKICNIELFGDIVINSLFIREKEQEFISDGYIPKKKTDCSYSDMNIIVGGKYINKPMLFNRSVDVNQEIKEIKEISIKLSPPTVRNNKMFSDWETIIVYENQSSVLTTAASSSEVEIDMENAENALSSISVKSFDYSISSSNKVDIRLNAEIFSYAFNDSNISLLSEIDVRDEDVDLPTLSVYFAKKNENIWDIAKRFSSDSDLIMNENSLQSMSLDSDKVLIIPRV